MLKEEISDIEISFKLFDAIIEALKSNIQNELDIKDFCRGIKNVECKFLKKHINVLIKCNFIEEKNDKYFLKGYFTKDKFLKRFLRKIVNEKIIDRGKIKSIEKSIFISNSVIKLEYSGMRNFLLEEQVFKYNNDNIENELLFEISQKYNYIFKTNDDIMTLDSLNKILELEKNKACLQKNLYCNMK